MEQIKTAIGIEPEPNSQPTEEFTIPDNSVLVTEESKKTPKKTAGQARQEITELMRINSDRSEISVPVVNTRELTNPESIIHKWNEVEATPDTSPKTFIEEQRALELIRYRAQLWLDQHSDKAAYNLFKSHGIKVEFGIGHKLKSFWKRLKGEISGNRGGYDEAYEALLDAKNLISQYNDRENRDMIIGIGDYLKRANKAIKKYNLILKDLPESERKDLEPLHFC